MSKVLIILAFLSLTGCYSQTTKYEGEAFIVTAGQTVITLPLVNIYAYSEREVNTALNLESVALDAYYIAFGLILFNAHYRNLLDSSSLQGAAANEQVGVLAHDTPGIDRATKFLLKYLCERTDGNESNQVATTDKDGGFHFEHSVEPILLVACAERRVLTQSEEYVWAVWIDKGHAKKIELNNSNMYESNCRTCAKVTITRDEKRKGVKRDFKAHIAKR